MVWHTSFPFPNLFLSFYFPALLPNPICRKFYKNIKKKESKKSMKDLGFHNALLSTGSVTKNQFWKVISWYSFIVVLHPMSTGISVKAEWTVDLL